MKRGGLWASCPLAPTSPQLRPPWRCLPQAGAGGDLGRSGSGSLQRLRVRWRVRQLGQGWGYGLSLLALPREVRNKQQPVLTPSLL